MRKNSKVSFRIDWVSAIPLLGTMTDFQLAKQLGCSHQNVSQKRVRLGISVFQYPPDEPLLEALVEQLGKKPDAVLAREHGVKVERLHAARKEKGISRYVAPEVHGVRTRYVYHGCRCEPCTAANAARAREYYKVKPEIFKANKERFLAKALKTAPHKRGKVSWYVAGCHCDGCRKAMRKYQRDRKQAQSSPIVVETAVGG